MLSIHHYISFTSHVSTALLKHVFIIFQLPYPHFRKQGVLPPSLGVFMTNRETTKAPVKTTVNLFFRKDKEWVNLTMRKEFRIIIVIPIWYDLKNLSMGLCWQLQTLEWLQTCHQHVLSLPEFWYVYFWAYRYALFKRWPLTLFLTLWKLENNLLGTPRAHKPFQGWFMDNSSIFCKCFSCSDLKTLKLHFFKLRISIFEEGIFGSFRMSKMQWI